MYSFGSCMTVRGLLYLAYQVLVQGRHVFMGYQGLPELTRDVFTQDGFLRSGDIGYINEVRWVAVTWQCVCMHGLKLHGIETACWFG